MTIEFRGGPKEAAKMIQGLAPSERGRILDEIATRDPVMAGEIRRQMVVFEDLVCLTPKLMGGLLREINPEIFGLAMRACSEELRKHLLSLVSSNNAREMVDVLKGKPMPLNQVLEAQEKILAIVRSKVEKGEISLVKGEVI